MATPVVPLAAQVSASGSIEKIASRTLPMVVLCGAIGGLTAAAVSRIFGVGLLLKWPLHRDLPIEVFMGAMAALFGCYLLTSTDFHETKGFVFAIACGVFWGPVITGAQTYMNQYATSAAVSETAIAARSALEQPDTGIARTAASVSEALSQVPATSDPADKKAISDNARNVVSAVLHNHKITPEAKTDALRKIGLASVANGASDVGVQSVQALGLMATTASKPSTRTAATAALQAIVNDAQKSGHSALYEIARTNLDMVRRSELPPSSETLP
jgi:hypothetical protein